jgi:glucosamine 6-phosphate synthetase-like amidotransferase/phosphosugar isomerase protein
MKLINLNQAVYNALQFFGKTKIPRANFQKINFPLVVGSGNAYNTGTILFAKQPAIFADESNFKATLKKYNSLLKKKVIKEVVVISASGEKDSVWELELAKKNKLKTTLLTCSGDSSAAKIAGESYIYRKLSEPYTYNTSTYLGMILSLTKEKPEKILSFLKQIKLPRNFKNYTSYTFVLPDQFIEICDMLNIKGRELFGPHLQVRAYSEGHSRHAKFVHQDKNELVIGLGVHNKYFGDPKHRLDIKVPTTTNYALMLCLGYSIIGRIQECKPAYFQKNITKFCQDYGPKAYGNTKPFDVIVSGN